MPPDQNHNHEQKSLGNMIENIVQWNSRGSLCHSCNVLSLRKEACGINILVVLLERQSLLLPPSLQGYELLMTSLRDPKERVQRAALHVFLPALGMWARELGEIRSNNKNCLVRITWLTLEKDRYSLRVLFTILQKKPLILGQEMELSSNDDYVWNCAVCIYYKEDKKRTFLFL